jgi:hypothetical protein
VITVLKLLTGGTAINLSAQLRGATMLNRPYGLTMRGEKFVSIFFAVVSAIFSKELSEF